MGSTKGGIVHIREWQLSNKFCTAISPEQRVADSLVPYKKAKNKGKYKAAHEEDTRLWYTTASKPVQQADQPCQARGRANTRKRRWIKSGQIATQAQSFHIYKPSDAH